MISCLIVDDEKANRDILTEYISQVPFLQLLAVAANPVDALELLKQHKIDLIFLDIQMPLVNGIEFKKQLGNNYKVIFVTAYDKYAVESYGLNAVDYLLKPVSFPRFLQAVEKVNKTTSPAQIADSIIVQGDNKSNFIKINFEEIEYIDSQSNYVKFVCTDRKVMSLMSLKDLEFHLKDAGFVRIHKSYLVRFACIDSVQGNVVILKGTKTELPVGNTYKEGFLELVRERMIKK